MIKILIADDHELVREGLKKVINNELDMKLVGEAGESSEIISKIKENEIDIIILDVSMPGRNGLDVLRDIRELKPEIKVIFLSMHPEQLYAERAFKLGAWGYLTKDSSTDEIVKAIRQVETGRKYVSDTFAQQLAVSLDENYKKPKHEELSDREIQVLKMIAYGKSIKDIAGEMMISLSTVNTYRSRIFEKMDLRSNTELIYYAILNRLIEIE